MRAFSAMRSVLAASVFALAGVFGVGGVAHANIVAVLGTISIGSSTIVTCETLSMGGCDASVGSDAGWLPDNGSFTHQIFFDKAQESSGVAINSTTVLTPINITSVELFLYTGAAAPLAGAGDLSGAFVATATSATFGGGVFWAMAGPLDSAGTYFVEIIGSTSGTEAQYTQQIAISAVPLPPALILLATALFGLIGVARIRRRRAVAA